MIEPEDPLEFPLELAATTHITIGMFYTAIRENLKGASFDGPRERQIRPAQMRGVIEVFDEKTAAEAIELTVEQGEGTSQSPLSGIKDELAHYYRFAEIYHGRELIPNPKAGPETPPDERYKYDGSEIPFESAGVRALVENPSTASYPEGSKARLECERFNYLYTQLLSALHVTFNGKPTRTPGGDRIDVRLLGPGRPIDGNPAALRRVRRPELRVPAERTRSLSRSMELAGRLSNPEFLRKIKAWSGNWME